MEITISEFRKNLKGYFAKALKGETVCIERGNVHYNLTARFPRNDNGPQPEDWFPAKVRPYGIDLSKTPSKVGLKKAKEIKGTAVTTQAPSYGSPGSMHDNKAQQADSKAKLCKVHGIRLDYRGKCLQKGCKYA